MDPPYPADHAGETMNAPLKTTTNLPPAACPRCGATLVCEPQGDCWCKHEPVRLPVPAAGESCLCPDCLRLAAASA